MFNIAKHSLALFTATLTAILAATLPSALYTATLFAAASSAFRAAAQLAPWQPPILLQFMQQQQQGNAVATMSIATATVSLTTKPHMLMLI